jgi:hypothetical protein
VTEWENLNLQPVIELSEQHKHVSVRRKIEAEFLSIFITKPCQLPSNARDRVKLSKTISLPLAVRPAAIHPAAELCGQRTPLMFFATVRGRTSGQWPAHPGCAG